MSAKPIDEYMLKLSGGLSEWELTNAKLTFGPFNGDIMPTVFFMDVEYDPVFVQFCPEGFIWMFNDQGASWTTLCPNSMKNLAKMAKEAVRMFTDPRVYPDASEGEAGAGPDA